MFSLTVWKSTQKCYHAENFSIKSHIKNLLNIPLQIHGFLVLGDIFGSFLLNAIFRPVFILEFI